MNTQERKAVWLLREAANVWPKSLWLFSANGTLSVMRKNDDGSRATIKGGGMDPEKVVADIQIENDGGDW